MDKDRAKYSQLFGWTTSCAKESDWFSEDGKTWNPDANWMEDSKYIYASTDFRNSIYDEIDQIMESYPPKTREDFSEELQKFLERVESRSNNGQA